MAKKIQIKRGLKQNLPTLAVAEFGLTTDTEEVFVGGNTANIGLAKASDVQAVTSQLADIATVLRAKKIEPPTNFTWKDSPLANRIWQDLKTGAYYTDYDVATEQVTGKTYYVSQGTGSDSNDGLTSATPFKTLLRAYNRADVKVIVICGNKLFYESGFNGTPIDKEITIKTLFNVQCLVSSHNFTTWTKTSSKTKVYQSTKDSVGDVVDITRKDVNGDYFGLSKVTTLDLCETTTDSFFFDSAGGILYVNFKNGLAPTNSLYALRSSNTWEAIFTSSKKVYFENLDILGGFRTNGKGLLMAKNCSFMRSNVGGSFSENITKTILQNCLATTASNDGFSYSSSEGSIEINCISRYNGDGIDGSIDNGSTAHAGSKVIRLNGDYHHNKGPNVVDVQNSTESWNIGVESHESLGEALQQSDFNSQDGASVMYLEGCKGYSSPYSVHTKGEGKIFIKGGSFESWNIYSQTTGGIYEYQQ